MEHGSLRAHIEHLQARAHQWRLGRIFFDRRFFNYFWTGGLFTVLNIVFVWLFIDILHVSTIVSSVIVIGGLFISRYLVYLWLEVM